jgi:hypothetical protein
MMNADGSSKARIASPSGAPDDLFWPGDAYGSMSTNRIVITVIRNVGDCWQAHMDSLWPDGSHRTTIDSGIKSCLTPPLNDIPGDADPGWSAGGDVLFTSRGYEVQATNSPVVGGGKINLRRILSVSADGQDVDTDSYLPAIKVLASQNPPLGQRNEVCCTDEQINQT